MRKATLCAKCGSDTTFSAPIYVSTREGARTPYVEAYENPDAFLFKKSHRRTIEAWVCGDCGYTELYTADARALYDIYHIAGMRHEWEKAERTQRPSALLLRPASSGEDTKPNELLRPADEAPQEKELEEGS